MGRAVVSLAMVGVSKKILRQLWSFCWVGLRLREKAESMLLVTAWAVLLPCM